MGTLTLSAIALDEVHQWFGAPAELADQLSDQARQVSVANPPLIRKVGPLLRRPSAPLVTVPAPSMDDVAALVEGRTLPADRLGFAWVIVRHWLQLRARHQVAVELSEHQLSVLDFSLVSAGLSSQLSFETVIARDPHLPLLATPGLSVGWMPNAHAVRAAAVWPQVFGLVAQRLEVADPATQLRVFFDDFARLAPNESPDILALYQR